MISLISEAIKKEKTMGFNKTARTVFLFSFLSYCFLYSPGLFFLVSNTVPIGFEWMASLILILQGFVAITWLIINFGLLKGLLASLVILFLGFAVEVIGVTTGFPFGRYNYTEILGLKLFEIPISITFAWLVIALSSFLVAQMILVRIYPNAHLISKLFFASFLALITDLLMEPIACNIQGYWIWGNKPNNEYYGIPLSNFIAWTVISFVMLLVLVIITEIDKKTLNTNVKKLKSFLFEKFLQTVYLMNIVFFTTINLTQHFLIPGVLGIIAGSICTFYLLRPNSSKVLPISSFQSGFIQQEQQETH